MKNLKNSNFNPRRYDIFKEDDKGNIIYTFLWKNYIIKSVEKEKKILEIESYKPYILSTKPPIFIPIIVFSFIISICYIFIFNSSSDIKSVVFYNTLGLYIIIISVYYFKIYLLLRIKK